MSSHAEKCARFLRLHQERLPLLMPNAWDAGSARLLASLGFEALATTSSGHAATLGRVDGSVTRDEARAHAGALVAATELPVSADLENAFADDPDAVAETVAMAVRTGLAGCSVEDARRTGTERERIYGLPQAAERVAAAAEAAHAGPARAVLTARAENYLHGRPDLEDTIRRLQAYEEAGADVLYAPGLTTREEIGAVVSSVECPVNVLARPGVPPAAELRELGVARISVGGAFAFAALAALVDAGREFREQGTYGFISAASTGSRAARAAFGAQSG